MNPPIVLLTDFGIQDGFPGVMKGVIATIAPDTPIIDLSHGVQAQNILHAAYLLASNYSYFPHGSVFCCVVDPGVGSNRRAIAVRTRNYFFIAPDNGLLTLIFEREQILEIRNLSNKDLHLPDSSTTFHGRDLFAPTAAHMTRDILFAELGEIIHNPIKLEIPLPRIQGSELRGEIIYTDTFGNLFSNISEAAFREFTRKGTFIVSFGQHEIKRVCNSYSEGCESKLSCIFNSWGVLEIFLNKGRADLLAQKEKSVKVVIIPEKFT